MTNLTQCNMNEELNKAAGEHGIPVYFSGTNVICNYTLGFKE